MSKLRIDIAVIEGALSCTEQLEALAFACMVKYNFGSSMIKAQNLKGAKFKKFVRDYFHIGFERGRRCVKNGLKYGYLKYDIEGNLIAIKINSSDVYTIAIDTNDFLKSGKINISKVKDALLSAVALNHTRKQTNCVDTCQKVDNPTSLKSYRKNVKRMEKCATTKSYSRLSATRLAKVLNVKVYKARKILATLTATGFLLCYPNLIEVMNSPASFSDKMSWIKNNMEGFLVNVDGKCYQRLANTYIYDFSRDVIRYEK